MRILALALVLAACVPSPKLPRLSQPVQVPLYHLGTPHRFVQVEIQGRNWLFLLDTGARESAVTPRAAQSMNLAVRYGGAPLEGIGGTAEADLSVIPALSLGGLAIKRLPVRVASLSTTFFADNPDLVAGYLGTEFLEKFHFGIDLTAGTLRLGAPGGAPFFTGSPVRVAVKPGPELLLPITVDGEKLLFEIDTGADRLLLFRNQTRLRGTPLVLSLGGVGPSAEVQAEALRVRELLIGELRFTNTDALILDLSRQKGGLLGADILSQVAFDYDPTRGDLLFWSRPLIAGTTGAIDARPAPPKPAAGPATVIDAGDVDFETR
jgi:predicted aspartyl protease